MDKDNKISSSFKWELLLSAEESDFYRCFHLCYDDLYRLGLYLYKDPHLVKESIQLLFIELWKMRERIREVTNIKEYALTIYKRVLYKQKTGSVKHWSKIDLVDTVTPGQHTTASYEELLILHVEADELRAKLSGVLPLLGDRQMELVHLRFFEEKTIDEIALITSLTPRTIYNTLHNAIARLKKLMS